MESWLFYFFSLSYSCCSHLEHRTSVKRFVSLQFLNLRQSVELLGVGISPSQGRYLTQTQTDIHALSGTRTHDPSVRAGEDISCLRQCSHGDRLAFLYERSIYERICWSHISNCSSSCHIRGNTEHGKQKDNSDSVFPESDMSRFVCSPAFPLQPVSLAFPQRSILLKLQYRSHQHYGLNVCHMNMKA
jgi:hypothetical protein